VRVDGPTLYPRNKAGVLNELGVQADNAGEPIDTTVGQRPTFASGSRLCLSCRDRSTPRRVGFDYTDQPWRARNTRLIVAPGAEVLGHIATAMTDRFPMAGGTCAAPVTRRQASAAV
jgi:hypothetical protein